MLPNVGADAIESGRGRIDTARLRTVAEDQALSTKYRFQPRDILYSKLRPYLRKAAVATFDGAASSEVIVLRAKSALAHPDYLVWLLLSPRFGAYAATATAGATLPRISRRSVLAFPLRLPPFDEQRRIAAELTEQFAAIDRARKASSGQRRAQDVLRGRIYADVFHGLIPLSVGRATPAANDGWHWRLLTDLARLESGHTPSRNRPDWWGGGVPWIALPDIRAVDGQVIRNTLETTNQEGIANSSARVLPPETVVMSRTASVGFVARMGMPMATSQDFVNWVCGPELDPAFLMHLLIRARGYVRDLSSGAIHKTVYVPTVKAFHVCVPSIARQRRIVAELREGLARVEAMTTAIEAEIEAIEALPATLLGRAFEQIDDAA